MNLNAYRFRFYLNANHYICINGKKGNTHPHTWELVLYISKINNDFFEFTNIEKEIDKYLSQFEGILLNDHVLFVGIDPTSENISARMLDELHPILNAEGWKIESLEISENPTRTFIIRMESDIKPAAQQESDVLNHGSISPEIQTNSSGIKTELSDFCNSKSPRTHTLSKTKKAPPDKNLNNFKKLQNFNGRKHHKRRRRKKPLITTKKRLINIERVIKNIIRKRRS